MKYSEWYVKILQECIDFKCVDEGTAFCRFGDTKPYWCGFAKCPKIPQDDKERDYGR